MKSIKLTVCVCVILFSVLAFADDVPVEDMSQTAVSGTSQQADQSSSLAPVTTESGDLDQRVARLEQQMQNFRQMNLPDQLEALRQQVQQLQGQLDEQTHNLQLLKQQSDDYYKDLDQRIKKEQSRAKLVTALPEQSDSSNISANSSSDLFNSGHDLQAYKEGFNLLMQRNYNDAATKLRDYLQNYPSGEYVANAHYWLGEVYYLQMNYSKSEEQFNALVDKYPKSNKVADAVYKLAIINLARGETSLAKQKLIQVRKQYPQSSAAVLAEQQLEKLNQL